MLTSQTSTVPARTSRFTPASNFTTASAQKRPAHGEAMGGEARSGKEQKLMAGSPRGLLESSQIVPHMGADDADAKTPLCQAAEEGDEGALQLILESGVDIETEDKHGRTALSWAAEMGQSAVIELLASLDRGPVYVF